MTTEQNKSIVRKYAELTNARDLEGAFANFSPSLVDHAVRPGIPPGIEGTRLFFNMQFTAFPDLHATIQDIIAERDKVVSRRGRSSVLISIGSPFRWWMLTGTVSSANLPLSIVAIARW